jgi:hypothetical protein
MDGGVRFRENPRCGTKYIDHKADKWSRTLELAHQKRKEGRISELEGGKEEGGVWCVGEVN